MDKTQTYTFQIKLNTFYYINMIIDPLNNENSFNNDWAGPCWIKNISTSKCTIYNDLWSGNLYIFLLGKS